MNVKVCGIFMACLLCLLGASVMLGWIFHIPVMVQVYPGFVAMSFNSGLLFFIVGLTVILANFNSDGKLNGLLIFLSLFVLFFALANLSQEIFKHSLFTLRFSAKAWLSDPKSIPGRMSPNTAVGFTLTGLALSLIFLRLKSAVNNFYPILVFFILMIALIGVLIYSLKLEYIFYWYQITRMAITTAFGFVVLSIALWCLYIQSTPYQELFENREENKITFMTGMLLIALTLITGLGSIAVITYSSFTLIQQAFNASMNNKIAVFENEIENVEKFINKISKNKNFENAILESLNDPKKTNNVFPLMFSTIDQLSIRLLAPNGKVLYQQGTIIANPQMSLPINTINHSKLMWQNGFWLSFNVPIYSNQKIIAQLQGQYPLPNINKWYFYYANLGTTGENVVCQRLNHIQAQCYPSRLNKHPFVIKLDQGAIKLPMYYAINGIRGVNNMVDYRRHRVIAGYSPINQFGLGFVVKIDAQEIYEPIQRLLTIIFPATLILILLGLLLLRWLVLPLVRKVIASEQTTLESKKRLEESEKRYQLAVTSSNIGLWDWDSVANCFYTSNLFRQLLGWLEEGNYSLANFLDKIHPEDRDQLAQIFHNQKNERPRFNIEYRIETTPGHYGWFQTIGQVISEKGNKRIVGSLIDINDRKIIEIMKGEFISIVSHELRTPLTSIQGAISLILSKKIDESPAKTTELLKIAHGNCERLANLINDILDIDKLESGQLKLQLQKVDIKQIVEKAITANQMFAEKLKVNLKLRDDLKERWITADPERLMQVLENLLSNAIKFSPTDGQVTIAMTQEDHQIQVAISDQGKGISEEFKKNIFKKFSQADSSSTRSKSGTGLGLAIAKSIIENMGGEINFYNNPEGGATFFFRLPILREK